MRIQKDRAALAIPIKVRRANVSASLNLAAHRADQAGNQKDREHAGYGNQ
jgi:hypothetical protein